MASIEFDEEAANARNRELMEQIKENTEAMGRWIRERAPFVTQFDPAKRYDYPVIFQGNHAIHTLCSWEASYGEKVFKAKNAVYTLLMDSPVPLTLQDAIAQAAEEAGCAPEDLCSYLLALGIGSLTR